MDPEQFVAQLAELRTQNQQLHPALQQVQQQQSQQQQQQSQQQSLIQALSDLPQSLAQTVGSAVLAAANPARTKPTLVDTKGLGKPPPTKNTENEFVSWARRTENFVVSVHPGARDVLTWAVENGIGNSGRSECSNRSCDASGHSANAGRSIVHSADDPCGRRIVRHPRGLWIWRRSGSLAASTQTLGPLDDWKSEWIARRNPFPWTCQAGRAARSSGRLEDLTRRYTQRRDAQNGQRHTLAEDIRMAALEALLPEELERHCQLQRSRLDTYQKLREEVVLYAEARGYVAPKLGQVSKAREDRDDPMDVGGFGQRKGRNSSKGKGKNSTGTGKGKGTGKDGKDGAKSSGRANTPKTQSQCWNCGKTGDKLQGLLGEPWQMATATESRTFKFSWKGK